jgi:predicted RNA-binding protein with TRAM domain
MKDNRSSTPPIKVDEEYTGRIDSVGGKGDGIFRVKGFVVFVPNVKRGDFVKVKITKVLAKVSFGEVVEKMEPPKNAFAPPKQKTEDVSYLLTTDGDCEDFGETVEEE